MFKYTEAEIKNILKQATVVIDTREQKCGHITEYLDKVYLNKDKVVEAVILELGRYISCGMTNADREKAYPRKLFEERIVKVIDHAYGAS